jgi:hypothetical protein
MTSPGAEIRIDSAADIKKARAIENVILATYFVLSTAILGL